MTEGYGYGFFFNILKCMSYYWNMHKLRKYGVIIAFVNAITSINNSKHGLKYKLIKLSTCEHIRRQ